MPQLVKITPEIFPDLYTAFLHDDDPLSSEQDWQNIFDYKWQKDEDYSGYALMEDGKVIGMIAMAFSNRLIDGQPHKFCNLHTWWVHEDHRSRSVAMLRPLLALKDHTITHFTPCDTIRALTKRLGFVDLDLQMKVLLPLGMIGRNAALPDNIQIAFDDTIGQSVLAEHDQKIFNDHQPYRTGSLFIQDGDDNCYIHYTCVERYWARYCHIHYVGNKKLYDQHEQAIRTSLMKKHRVRFVIIDSRLTKCMNFRRSFDFWAPANAVYKPAGDITPDQVDNLYSDVVMLRLAIMPHISHEIKETAKRWFKKYGNTRI